MMMMTDDDVPHLVCVDGSCPYSLFFRIEKDAPVCQWTMMTLDLPLPSAPIWAALPKTHHHADDHHRNTTPPTANHHPTTTIPPTKRGLHPSTDDHRHLPTKRDDGTTNHPFDPPSPPKRDPTRYVLIHHRIPKSPHDSHKILSLSCIAVSEVTDMGWRWNT